MAKPQPTDAHLRVAHSIQEQIMVSHFTEQQRRILDLILRLSWGCHKKVAIIPHQADFEIVGVLRGHIRHHLDWLVAAKVITRDGDAYTFNKDFDQWRVNRAWEYTPEKLGALIKLNLNGSGDAELDLEESYGLRNHVEGLEVKGSYGKRNKTVTDSVTLPDSKHDHRKKRKEKTIYNSIGVLDREKSIWEFWNTQGIINHRTLTSKARLAITRALKDYEAYELCQAIQNYSTILNGSYRWNYRWTLEDFLARGIAKFVDLAVAKQNYAWPKGEGKHIPHDRDKYIQGRYGHLVRRSLDEEEGEEHEDTRV